MHSEYFMSLAVQEAWKGCGWVNPNPMVGAVIVKDGRIIGKGHHEKYGSPHAERNALSACSESPEGATLYVTLEPCCHRGQTPPCTDALIESGIKKVIAGMEDPNPLVAGKGFEILKKHGIETVCGVLEKECRSLNEVFCHFIAHNTPFVAIKYAMTLDGKIATASGKSKWITGEKAREHVHWLRHRYSAVMAGAGTVISDDPMLNCRLPEGKDPVRIICDTNLRIPLEARIVRTAHEFKTYIATGAPEGKKSDRLRDKGAEIISVPMKNAHIDLNELMKILGGKKIDSILLEGGGTLNASALACGIVNKAFVYIAPKIFGGESAKSPVGGRGADKPEDAMMLRDRKITELGDDILLEYSLK